MTKLPVFDFKKVNVAWGALPIYAFGDDNSVVVTPSADVSTRYVGGDGIPSISMNTDRICLMFF